MSNFKSCKMVDIQESLPFDIDNKKQQQHYLNLFILFHLFIIYLHYFLYLFHNH